MPGVPTPPTQEESKGFLPLPLQRIKLHRRAGILKYDHHSIFMHDSHAMVCPRYANASGDKLRVILLHQGVAPAPALRGASRGPRGVSL